MKIFRTRYLLVAFVFLVVFARYDAIGVASAAGMDPLAEMRSMMDQILKILDDERYDGPEMQEEKRRQVMAAGNKHFDYRAMSQSALARLWRGRTETERQRFVELFTKLVEQVYIIKAIDAYEGQEVLFKGERVQGDRAEVSSVVIDKGKEIPILYRLHIENGQWLVYDVLIEGVSMIANYRRQFQSSNSFEEVLGWLEKTVGDNQSSG